MHRGKHVHSDWCNGMRCYGSCMDIGLPEQQAHTLTKLVLSSGSGMMSAAEQVAAERGQPCQRARSEHVSC